MQEESSLAALSSGSYGLVEGLAVGGAMGCRLRDLGFLPGASVEALGKSPLGDPDVYKRQLRHGGGLVCPALQPPAGGVPGVL